MEKIYRALHAWAERKIHECQQSDCKCEHCKRWYSVAGLESWKQTEHPMIDEAKCGCGQVTKWWMAFVMPVRLSSVQPTAGNNHDR